MPQRAASYIFSLVVAKFFFFFWWGGMTHVSKSSVGYNGLLQCGGIRHEVSRLNAFLSNCLSNGVSSCDVVKISPCSPILELNDFVIQLDEEVEGMQSTILTLQHQLKDCKQLLSQSQENVKTYEDKLKTSERLLAEMRQQNSPVSVKLEDQDEHVQAQAQTQGQTQSTQGQTQSSQAHSWTDSAECATGDTTSPVAAKSEESKESEERILLSASVTVPAMKPASVPSAFSISQLLATDSNPGKENKTEHAQDNLENGGSNHESSPSEPIDMGESPLVAAMGVVERIGSEPNTFNGEVTG